MREAVIYDYVVKYTNLFDKRNLPEEVGKKNCENFKGSIVIPVGLAGPLIYYLNGRKHKVMVPLATLEGALIASINRGMKLLGFAGGVRVIVENQGITRAPVFECENGEGAVKLRAYLMKNEGFIAKAGEATSMHLNYRKQQMWIRGRYLYVRWSFQTDQAMGMNMATIASQAMGEEILKNNSKVKFLSVSSNMCCDKKDNVVNGLLGRGFWVQAEVIIGMGDLMKVMRVDTDELIKVHIQKNLIGSNLAGSNSQSAQAANVVSALFLATGQDIAQVVEGSKAFLSLEKQNDKLYAAVTLPNVDLGIIGGGTYLPAQTEARLLMEIKKTEDLAAIIGATVLAGEVSLMASLTEGNLAESHKRLART